MDFEQNNPEKCSQKKSVIILQISLSYTLGNPRTMVVHSFYTCVAIRAVVSSGRAKGVAFETPEVLGVGNFFSRKINFLKFLQKFELLFYLFWGYYLVWDKEIKV